MSEPVNLVVEHYDNEELAEANEQLAMMVAKLHIENDKLRELVQSFHSAMLCTLDTGIWPTDPEWLESRMRELGVDA